VLAPRESERAVRLLVDEPAREVVGVITEVIVKGTPKWRARQVTVSPSPIVPVVTPEIARPPGPIIDAVWASTDSDRSKRRKRRLDPRLQATSPHSLSARRHLIALARQECIPRGGCMCHAASRP